MIVSGPHCPEKGFTLIELMIGLALVSIIGLGITQFLVANAQTYKFLGGQSRVQESGRFALETLIRSAQMAGFKGCFSTNDEVHKTFLADIPYEFDLTSSLLGYEGETTAWVPDIEAVLPRTVSTVDTNVYAAGAVGPGSGIDTDSILRKTDIFTINYISEKKHRLNVNMPTSAEEVEVDTTDFEFASDYMAYIHDCEKGTIFRVTGFGGGGEIQHNGVIDPDGYTNALLRLAEFNTFETDAYVSAIVSHTFFIAPGEAALNAGNTTMSLWRKVGPAAPEELVEGIEDLQVKYGVDTDGDDVPNRYLDADAVIDFNDVLTLRITVTSNSVEDVGGNTGPTHGCTSAGGAQDCQPGETFDGLLRRAFTQTINLKNRG
jgi:type IV pilus assembly protein PilW